MTSSAGERSQGGPLRHQESLRALARKLATDVHDVDDLVQETLLRALQEEARGQHRSVPWLHGVLRDTHRAERQRPEGQRRGAPLVTVVDPHAAPTEQLGQLESWRAIFSVLRRMKGSYRQVLESRFLDGLSLKQTGARLGLPIETVRTRQRRALTHLRQSLKGERGLSAWWLGQQVTSRRQPLLPVALSPARRLLPPRFLRVLALLALPVAAVSTWYLADPDAKPDSLRPKPSRPVQAAALRRDVPGSEPRAPISAIETLEIAAEATEPVARGLRFVVNDLEDRPIPGARIWIARGLDLEHPQALGETNAEGRLSAQLSVQQLFAWAEAPGRRSSSAMLLDFPCFDREPAEQAVFFLHPRARRVEGTVVAAGGRSLAVAEVSMREDTSDLLQIGFDGTLRKAGRTAPAPVRPDGSFVLDGVARPHRQSGWLVVSERGRAVHWMRISARRAKQPLHLVVPRPVELHGRVLGPDGGAASDVELRIVSEARLVQRECRTDANGLFLVPDLPHGKYAVTAFSDLGFAERVLAIGQHPRPNIDLRLRPDTALEVLGQEQDGRPLSGWRVLLATPHDFDQDVLVARLQGAPPVRSSVLDARGRARFQDARARPSRLFLVAPGEPDHLPRAVHPFEPGGRSEVILRPGPAPRPASLSGHLARPRQQALPAAWVALQHESVPRPLLATVAPDGSFRLDGLPPGRAQLRLIARGLLCTPMRAMDLDEGETRVLRELAWPGALDVRLQVLRSDGTGPHRLLVRSQQAEHPLVARVGQSRAGLTVEEGGLVTVDSVEALSSGLLITDGPEQAAWIELQELKGLRGQGVQLRLEERTEVQLRVRYPAGDDGRRLYRCRVIDGEGHEVQARSKLGRLQPGLLLAWRLAPASYTLEVDDGSSSVLRAFFEVQSPGPEQETVEMVLTREDP